MSKDAAPVGGHAKRVRVGRERSTGIVEGRTNMVQVRRDEGMPRTVRLIARRQFSASGLPVALRSAFGGSTFCQVREIENFGRSRAQTFGCELQRLL